MDLLRALDCSHTISVILETSKVACSTGRDEVMLISRVAEHDET